jgi:hypothetical protein
MEHALERRGRSGGIDHEDVIDRWRHAGAPDHERQRRDGRQPTKRSGDHLSSAHAV